MHQSPFIFCVCVLLQWLLVTRSYCGLATSDTVPSSQLIVTHSATILGTNEPRNLRVLYRLFGPDTREYVFVSGTNHIYQFDAHNLQHLAARVIGPQNFSIFCSDEHDCSYCLIGPHETWPKGYSPNFCGPRPTDNFVKAWATSTVSENDVVRNSYTFVPVVINDDRIACEDALYVCYNVHHGYCERVRLHNVTKEAPWRTTHLDYADHPIPGRVPVVGCDPITHATIVVGARYVYTATEPDIQRLFTLSALDPLSVRSRDFYFVDSTPERKSVVSLDDPPIPLQYKASFRYRTRATFVPVSDPTVNVPPAHVYFVLQQPDHVSFIRWQPRVARICEGDKRFYSYVELNLACSDCVPLVDRDQKTLNALHTASRGQVGRNLARQLNASITHVIHRLHSLLPVSLSASRAVVNNSGLEDFHEVLLVAFAAQPVDPPMYWNTYDLQHGPQSVQYIRSSFFPNASDDQIGALLLAGSALSLFSMAHIDAQFNNVIRNCLEGHGTRGPSHFMRSTDREYIGCVHEAYLADEPYYCPTKPPMNRFITGETQEDSLRAPSFLYTTKNVTGVAITAVSADFTVCLITTDDGWLYKYEVTSVNDSRQLESKLLAPLGTPLTGISLDITGTVAFVTSLNKVFRVELSNCDAYHTCKACLEARDPYCGWCMSEGRCSRIDQCQIPSQPVMPYGNRAKHDQRKRRWDSPEVTQNNDYCANKFTPGYAMPSSTESWLPYTSPVSNCPTIRAIRPPGIQERRKAKSLEHSKDIQSSDSTGISTIVLHLEDSLVNDPRFRAFILNGSGLEKSSTDNFDSVNARHLVCAFRSAPDQWMQSESVLAGAWLPMSQMHSLLTNIRPGPVLTSTIARPILSANGSLEIHCDAPSLHQLPSLPARQASLPLVLWLDWFTPEKTKHNNRNENTQMKSAGHHASLVSGLFAIYDCARLADCRACSHSRFHCAWCLLEDRCVPSSWLSSTTAEQLCTRSTHLSELGTTNQEDAAPLIVSSGRSAECPRFTTDGQQITLMSGTPLSVTFHVYNVKRPLQHFTCEEGCNGQRVIPFYDPEKSLVICRNLTINVTEQLGNLQRHISNWSEDTTWSRTGINCSLNLYWHGHDSRNRAGHRMINEDNVKVEVYSCEMLAKHCDECLALPSRFGCGWCTSTLSGQSTTDAHVMCTTRAQCLTRKSLERVTSPAIRTKWLQSGSLCPNPQITSIYPLNGTLTGRPVLHVRGINLGRTVSDLVGHVQLDGPQPVACHVQTQAYFSSRAFTCQLDSAAHFTLPAHGRLKVVVSKYKYQAFSPVFHFLAPRLYEVHPERGPVAGGTRLKLHGSNLNIGANRTVWLLSVGPNADSQRVSLDDTLHRANTSVPCSVESETPELIVCRTGILPFNMSAVIASQRDSQPTANRVRKHVETNPSSQDAPIERGARSDVIKSNPVAPFMPMSLVLMHDLTPTFPIRPFTYLYSPNPQISTVRRQNVLAR
ncbi:hypothetical protein D915_000334 [Fasciola hepatica]|uniref:Sema domain-containing protein n=1 Tax=Fasciola hepatica TaxID=6192 RepID=A0A4E0RRT6_FASHE|nr:hypothetical protein D915_000334 [Fasciola hepatica]